jgi:hypothetical protein
VKLCAHTSTLRVSSLGSFDTDFGAGVSSSATAEAALLRVGIVYDVCTSLNRREWEACEDERAAWWGCNWQVVEVWSETFGGPRCDA